MTRHRVTSTALAFALGVSTLLAGRLIRGQELASADPIGGIAADMDEVVIDLSGLNTGAPTRKAQSQIVSKLDKLIEELEKECEACRGGGSGANPSKPLADSTIIGGPGGSGDLHGPSKDGKRWGELPPHQRDQILQSLTEGFPPHYQRILERYYKRLAEETPTASADSLGDEAQPSAGAASNKPKSNSGKQPAKRNAKSAKSRRTNGAKSAEGTDKGAVKRTLKTAQAAQPKGAS